MWHALRVRSVSLASTRIGTCTVVRLGTRPTTTGHGISVGLVANAERIRLFFEPLHLIFCLGGDFGRSWTDFKLEMSARTWCMDRSIVSGSRAMSRCFPFPPPGYEKKARIEDKDLLTKEKHKEKKHKKDKKDKEKREGKEKRDKDKERSKEKHRDKNDQKEKLKDKKCRDKDKEKNCTSDAKKIEGQPECYNGEKLGSNCLQNKEIKASKFVQDLARRIKDEGGATGSQIAQKIIVTDQRGGKLPGRLVECSTDSQLEEKEKAKNKKVNGQRNYVEARGLPNAIVQGFSGNAKPPDAIKTNSNGSAGEGSLGKRKELEINGNLHVLKPPILGDTGDNGIRPNKLPRPVSSSHPVMENGRKPAMHFASEQGAANNHKVDMKEHKINGLVEDPQPTLCSTKPLSTIVQVSENGEASLKQPHPDSKYLNQILSLPKVADWSDLDDQEWLFSGNSLQSKKPKVGSPGVDGKQQVWAEPLRIETADLIALPFVIPY
ncbi:hypothetical protein JRO89_XS01G0052100 [Xanthoceras sorbifolium]|uniref:Uncharacterized protein n=1 Tax=Xanthoceras sorbifolium TaxID=99658 RepID=A0ABQ8II90_9ROSI|nr:hypothetical protein JRO89_XS01G0052100 [Xanthoceras sorbifolium]